VFCEITIRRLERYRRTGKLGWQNGHAFEHEIPELPDASDGSGTARSRVLSSQPTLFE
jgi:hypothetical protein